jgi:hypothetical protein
MTEGGRETLTAKARCFAALSMTRGDGLEAHATRMKRRAASRVFVPLG